MTYRYILQSCDQASYPNITNLCYTELFTDDLNKVVYLPENPTRLYYLLQAGLSECEPDAQELPAYIIYKGEVCENIPNHWTVKNCVTDEELIFNFVNYQVIAEGDCGTCPLGYEYNSELALCEKIEDIAIVQNTVEILDKHGGTGSANDEGGKFYDTSLAEFPLHENVFDDILDSNNAVVPFTESAATPWLNSGSILGRLNASSLTTQNDVFNEWVGVSKCLDVPVTKKYCFGIGSDDRVKITIDGQLKVIMDTDSNNVRDKWHVFEIELEAGQHIIEVEGWNDSGNGYFGAEIYDATLLEVTAWTTELEVENAIVYSTAEHDGLEAQIGTTVGYTCPDGYSYNFCDPLVPTCSIIDRLPIEPCTYGIVTVDEYPCDCWQIIGLERDAGNEEIKVTVSNEYKSCAPCVESSSRCEEGERTISYLTKVVLPDELPPDRGFKECCYDNIVLANDSGKDNENDYNSFWFKKQIQSDDCDFVLIRLEDETEYSLNDSTYGVFKDFTTYPTQPNLKTITVEWSNVLELLGEGNYQIRKEMTIAGMQFIELSNTFTLKTYTIDRANSTIRIDTVMNGTLVHYNNVNFKGTNYRDSLRIKGFFGRRNPKYTKDSIVGRDYVSKQITMSQENEYKLQGNKLPICITEYLYDFILFGNEIFVTDYNKNNHSYNFTKFAVEFTSNKSIQYYVENRDAMINLTFSDRKKNVRKTNC